MQFVARGQGNYRELEPMEIKPGHRLRDLGTIEIPVAAAIRRGIFLHYHRFRRPDPPARPE